VAALCIALTVIMTQDPSLKCGKLTHRTLRADPPSEHQVHSKVSLRRAVDAVQRCGVACVRTGKRHVAQAACNLAVAAAEESLSILPEYTPTVRPPPKRC
jgi:hypothetical protein